MEEVKPVITQEFEYEFFDASSVIAFFCKFRAAIILRQNYKKM